MTIMGAQVAARVRPLVAVVCVVPLLGEAVRSALDFADVQTFSAANGDLGGLLHWLRPNVVIVDTDAGAEEAAAFARDNELPVLHISMQDRVLRFYHGGFWEHVGNGEGPTPESIRNVVAGAIYGREVRGA